ncbi:MAG: glycosyltransferase [Kiritimatiellales bacterium]
MVVFSKKTVIFSHFSATGATEELRDWLVRNKAREVVYVACPFMESKQSRVFIDVFRNGELVLHKEGCLGFKHPEPLAYLRDMFYLLFYGFRFGRQGDILVAGDCLLGLAGLILRAFGAVHKVIYYVIDFTPRRFVNPLVNRVYITLDRLLAYRADQTWVLCKAMMEGRELFGQLDPARSRWKEVPYGNHPVHIAERKKHEPLKLVYMGGIMKNKGAELFIPTAGALIEAGIDFHFHIVGGGPDLETIRQEAAVKQIESRFTFHGFLDEFSSVLDILVQCDIALAPYNPNEPNSFAFYADPGKIKTYLGCGLPVVLTKVPPIAERIRQNGAGIIAGYQAGEFVDAIRRIRENLAEYSRAAFQMGEAFSWDRIFTKVWAIFD